MKLKIGDQVYHRYYKVIGIVIATRKHSTNPIVLGFKDRPKALGVVYNSDMTLKDDEKFIYSKSFVNNFKFIYKPYLENIKKLN